MISDGSASFPVSSFSTSRRNSSFGSSRALCNQCTIELLPIGVIDAIFSPVIIWTGPEVGILLVPLCRDYLFRRHICSRAWLRLHCCAARRWLRALNLFAPVLLLLAPPAAIPMWSLTTTATPTPPLRHPVMARYSSGLGTA